MTKNTKAPSKPANPDGPKRGRRRKARMEDHPEVQTWIGDFIRRTEDEQGYTPTDEQAIQAFLAAALKALRVGDGSAS